MDYLNDIIQSYGLFAGITIYMIRQQRQDYSAVCGRLNKVETFVQNELMTMNSNSNSALKESSEVIRENNLIIKENQELLKLALKKNDL